MVWFGPGNLGESQCVMNETNFVKSVQRRHFRALQSLRGPRFAHSMRENNLFSKEDAKDTWKPTLKPFKAKGNTVLHTSMAAERVIEGPWDVANRASCHLPTRTRQALQRLIDERIIIGVELEPLKKDSEGRIIPDAPCRQCCRYRMKEIPNQH